MSDVTETTTETKPVIDANNPEVRALIDNEVNGLKAKNSELLGKIKEFADFKKQFDGIDPEKYRKIIPLFEQNEEAQLIADGKIDDVIKRRTEKMQAEYEGRVNTAHKHNETLQQQVETYKARLAELTIDKAVIAEMTAAGALPSAIEDAVLHAHRIFKLEDDGSVVARDKDGNLLKSDKGVLDIKTWVDMQRTAKEHWFGKAQGVGAKGSGNTAGAGLKRSTMTVAEKVNYAKEHGQEAFLALPN